MLAAQERAYEQAVERGHRPNLTVLVIEEAHEFLSAARARQMPVLFEEVARIARRGRKRWLGLAFVSQLPQHLPSEVYGLINAWVLHRVSDNQVVKKLRESIAGVDDALWRRLPGLAPGQAYPDRRVARAAAPDHGRPAALQAAHYGVAARATPNRRRSVRRPFRSSRYPSSCAPTRSSPRSSGAPRGPSGAFSDRGNSRTCGSAGATWSASSTSPRSCNRARAPT